MHNLLEQWIRMLNFPLQLLEICMEGLGTSALYAMPSSVLSAFSCGLSTSLVVDVGHDGTFVCPVVDGYELKQTVVSSSNGGRAIDQQLIQRLKCSNKFYPTLSNKDFLHDVKKHMCVLPHFRVDPMFRTVEGLARLGLNLPSPYELPDGNYVDATYDICLAAEDLFFPEHIGLNADGSSRKRARELLMYPINDVFSQEALHDLIYLAAGKADVDTRKELLANIAVVGGGSLMAGLHQRLTKELSDIVPSHYKVS
jgi:actin-related protein